MPTVNNPATPGDVQLERPLSDGEVSILPSWLDRAWTILQREVPGVAARMQTIPPTFPAPPGVLERDEVVEVLVAMVERKLRNPDGLRSYGVDDATTTVDATLSSGQIAPTPAEIARLSVPVARSGGVFSMMLGR